MPHSDSVKIRTCTVDDVSILVTLGIQTFRETFEDVNTPENMRLYFEATFNHEKIRNEIVEPGALFFLAEINNFPVGFAKVRASEKPEGLNSTTSALELERLYAIKQFIGKGIGQLLMQKCVDHGKQLGFETLWLGVWEHNVRAISFYEKWGFETFGDHVFMLGHDAQTDLLMKKSIL